MTADLAAMLAPAGGVTDLAGDVRWTGAELGQAAATRAAALRRHGAGPGDRYLIVHGDTPSFLVDLLAVWRIGGTAVCLNPGLTDHELATVAAFVEPAAVLTETRDVAYDAAPTLRLAEEKGGDGETANGPADAQAAALILFTSGTTGAPKGVTLSYRAIADRLRLNRAAIGDATLRRALCPLPTHFGHGLIGGCLTAMSAGGEVCLMHGLGAAGAQRLGPILDAHEVSFMTSVPAFWKLALRVSPSPESASLERIHIGSAPLAAGLWRDVGAWADGAEVVNMYGTTETANWTAGASSRDFAPEDGLIGRMWGGEAAVLTADGERRDQGEGEILVRTPSAMQGYLKRPDLTAEVLQDGWYATGDIGRLEGDGVLRLSGRARYVINQGGAKIYPEEIDLLLERRDDVVEACCFAVADPVAGETVGAAIALAEGATADRREIAAWAKQMIRAEAAPKKLFILDDIPKTPRGKFDRDAVARHCLEGAA